MRNRKLLIAGVTALVLLLLSMVWWFNWRWSAGSLVVSRETTYIDGPFHPDGQPDYTAALNNLLSAGVTPENNAAVLLLRAMGPAEVSAETSREFFQRLGIPPLSPTANYFDNWYFFARRFPAEQMPVPAGMVEEWLDQIYEQATQRPWSDAEFPLLSKWLDRNEPQLEMILAASERTHYYAPLIPTGDPPVLAGADLPLASAARAASQALVIRAMLRLKGNQVDAAWDDLMSARRLGRLVGRGGTLLDAFNAYGIDGAGATGQAALIAETELSAEKYAAMQRHLDELPPLPSLADVFDRSERLQSLDLRLAMSQRGPGALSEHTGDSELDLLNEFAMRGGDWNVALRVANEWMDRYAAVARIEDSKVRAGELERIQADIMSLYNDVASISTVSAILSDKQATERNAKRLILLTCPAMAAVFNVESRTKSYHDLLRVALAIAHFKAENGKYPQRLQELVPQHLAKVPPDAFAGTPFVYNPRPEGFLLYGLGMNQKDEGGQSYDQDGDDQVIEVPRRDLKNLPLSGAQSLRPSSE